MHNGLLLFAKYAFAPNILKYCGPRDNHAFLEILKSCSKDGQNSSTELSKELENLSLKFEGAVPYLTLIAGANNVKDIFDSRVVEAYWLGNNLLEKVNAHRLYRHIEDRFKKRMGFKEWHSMKNSPKLADAKPFHNFHVFNIYSQIRLTYSSQRDNILKTMDNCKIGWGTVKDVIQGNAVIEYFPLKFDRSNNLKLSDKTTRNFYLLDSSIKKNDEVSLHWNFICDKLNPYQKRNLIYWTNYHIKIFNK